MKTERGAIRSYVTRDDSLVRELFHPAVHGEANLSLAEAEVAPGAATVLHRHHRTEEIYHVLAGTGTMTLDGDRFPLAAGDTVLIRPGQAHCLENTGAIPLRILCCCTPAYAHYDTELLSSPP